MNNFIYQTNNFNCGFASLKMLLSITFKSEDYLYIPELNVNQNGYSLLDLKNVAKNYGADLETIKCESLDEININKSFIYIKTNENGNKHCVLVKKKYKKISIIYDPDKGKKIVKNDEFFEEREHIITYIKSSNKIDFHSEKLFEKSNLILLSVFQIISIGLIFFGMFMVDQSNEKKKLIFSIAFIFLGLLVSLIQRLLIYKMMEEYDSKFLIYTHDENLTTLKKNYNLMHNVKTFILTNYSKIIINIIFSIFINIALIVNNYKSIYIGILVLFLTLIDIGFVDAKTKENKEEINKLEDNLLNYKFSEEEYSSKYEELKINTYKYAKTLDIKRLIYYSLIFALSFIMFIFSENHLISILILYFFSGVISYNYINETINLINNNKTNIINKTKFLTLINSKKNLANK